MKREIEVQIMYTVNKKTFIIITDIQLYQMTCCIKMVEIQFKKIMFNWVIQNFKI